jgi:hypothetical protein
MGSTRLMDGPSAGPIVEEVLNVCGVSVEERVPVRSARVARHYGHPRRDCGGRTPGQGSRPNRMVLAATKKNAGELTDPSEVLG